MNTEETLKQFIYILVKSNDINFLTIKGQPGLGKSFNTARILKEMGLEENVHFKVISGYITPKKLFETLGKTRILEPPRLIIIDDLDALLNSKISVSILKSALVNFNNQRIVRYESTRNNEEQSFEFNGKIIMIVNQIPSSSGIEPLLDRGIVFYYKFNPIELMSYIEEFVLPTYGLEKQATYKVWNKVKRFVDSPSFSIRDLNRAINFYKHDQNKWFELFIKSIKK